MTIPLAYWSGVPEPVLDSPDHEPMGAETVAEWSRARQEICAHIAENPGLFKIVLKTKDDPYFLESWIQHHARIVGLRNLVIFDNMSTNAQVLAIYAKYGAEFPIARFHGNHNALHHTTDYPELYECLTDACRFYMFLDTDEFLVFLNEDDTYFCDHRIVDFLQAHDRLDVFPGTWLPNATGSDRRFVIGTSVEEFTYRLAAGKAIIRAGAGHRGFLNHNNNLDKRFFAGDLIPNFFVLHLTKLFPQQRRAANINKLIALNFASPGESLEAIAAKDVGTVRDPLHRLQVAELVSQLKQLDVPSNGTRTPAVAATGRCIELTDRGEILYDGARERKALTVYLTGSRRFIRAVLQTEMRVIRTTPLASLKRQWTAAEASRTAAADTARMARLLTFYLPQFYPIPENNRWWGTGFTEWTNVARARPLFAGHCQPHVPAHLGFYDLRLREVRQAQADLAKSHGIEGFCYWHYWFHGKRLLHRPFDEVLASRQPDFPFCLAWANETWSRRWHGTGAPDEVLQQQTYSPEDDVNHIRWLLEAFADPRYVRVGGRPLFVVYKPADLPDPKRTTDTFRSECARRGMPEPFLVASNSHADRDYTQLGFDRTLEFEPQLGLLQGPTEPGLKLYDYADARRRMASRRRDFPTYPSIFVRWDNTPRRAENGIVFTNSTPECFEQGLSDLVRSVQHKPFDDRIIFINAWNEWAEGNHLEPDLAFGTAYLEAVRRANSLSTAAAAEGSGR